MENLSKYFICLSLSLTLAKISCGGGPEKIEQKANKRHKGFQWNLPGLRQR
jgi:hypothetical protein